MNALQRRLHRHGWAVVDLLGDRAVARARSIVEQIGLEPDHGFYASPAHDWGEAARATHDALRHAVTSSASRLLPAHRIFLAGVTSKGSRSATTVPLHQDWTYTDERKERAIFLWCPLVDVDQQTGSLSLVTGSHRWSDGIRPSRSHEAAGSIQELLRPLSIATRLRAGQAIAFDPATIHGSGPNTSDQLRPALTLALVPSEARLVHFHELPDGSLRGYCVDDDFYTTNEYGREPEDAPGFPVYRSCVSESELRLAALAQQTRAGRRRLMDSPQG